MKNNVEFFELSNNFCMQGVGSGTSFNSLGYEFFSDSNCPFLRGEGEFSKCEGGLPMMGYGDLSL